MSTFLCCASGIVQVQFQPDEAYWGYTIWAHSPGSNQPPTSPHRGITFYIERVIIIQNDMILLCASRCSGEGGEVKQKCAQFVCRFASSLHGSCFLCRFKREKKSSMMSADLNKDLFVIFASGPIGVSLLLSITS